MMKQEKFTLFATSSTGDYYEVTLNFAEDRISAVCSCPAGMFNQWCKHKTAFLTGDELMLFDSNQTELFKTISIHVSRSKFPAEYEKLQSELKEIEIRKKRLSKQAIELKNVFARNMSEGL